MEAWIETGGNEESNRDETVNLLSAIREAGQIATTPPGLDRLFKTRSPSPVVADSSFPLLHTTREVQLELNQVSTGYVSAESTSIQLRPFSRQITDAERISRGTAQLDARLHPTLVPGREFKG